MHCLVLDDNKINIVKQEAAYLASELLKEDLEEVILYGSCARGIIRKIPILISHCLQSVTDWKQRNIIRIWRG